MVITCICFDLAIVKTNTCQQSTSHHWLCKCNSLQVFGINGTDKIHKRVVEVPLYLVPILVPAFNEHNRLVASYGVLPGVMPISRNEIISLQFNKQLTCRRSSNILINSLKLFLVAFDSNLKESNSALFSIFHSIDM